MARAIIHSQTFNRQLLVIPRAHWAGHEADLLCIDPRSMRLIELEIKVSREDLFADAKKDKWWARKGWDLTTGAWAEERMRQWPRNIWKHYYVVPLELWRKVKGSLEGKLPAASGVIAVTSGGPATAFAHVGKRCKPNRRARAVTAEDALDIARLCGLRMWDAIIAKEMDNGRHSS